MLVHTEIIRNFDGIDSAPALELSVMVVPSRDLPVEEAVQAIRPKMEAALSKLECSDVDKRALEKFLRQFEQSHVVNEPFLKPGLILKEVRRQGE